MVTQYLAVLAHVLLIVVFAVSAVGKLRDRSGFAASLAGLGTAARQWSPWLVWLVPLAEAAVTAALLTGLTTGTGWIGWVALAGALCLLGLFTAVIAVALAKGIKARCNCFGRDGAQFAPRHIARNVVLMIAAAAGTAGVGTGVPASPEMALAGGIGLILAILAITMDDLSELFRTSAPQSRARGIR